MAEPDVQGRIENAVKSGQYPDRKAAIAGLVKQLAGHQKGILKNELKGNPVDIVEQTRARRWKEMLEQAGGDEDKAVQLYVDEIKKIGGQ